MLILWPPKAEEIVFRRSQVYFFEADLFRYYGTAVALVAMHQLIEKLFHANNHVTGTGKKRKLEKEYL